MGEEESVVCPECGGKFDVKRAEWVSVRDEVVPRCPFCGVLRFLRCIDEDEGIVDDDVADDPLPDGGENPVSV